MTTHSDPKFQVIDDALAKYYHRLNVSNYRDSDGVGLFLKYIIDEELDDPDVPIENELGDDCDPNDCAYSWMDNDTLFPIPPYAQIAPHEKEAFIFYILQYCYKHNQPPSDSYIQQTLIPKCNGTVNTTYLPQTLDDPTPPIPFAGDLSLSDDTKAEIASNYSSPSDLEGLPQTTTPTMTRLSKHEFKPKYPARAHLNIFTAKELTKELRHMIIEDFENELILYYYSDISTALQINDHQMQEFTLQNHKKKKPLKLSLINYDLHNKNGQYLYGVIIPNDNYKIQQDKWLWKLDEFLTATQIFIKYNITSDELPLSSRKMSKFCMQLQQTLVIEESLIDETDWFSVQQIKSLKRNVRLPKVTVVLSKEMWMMECKKSFQDVGLPLIPVVVNKNNNHWIEWVKIVCIESQNIYVGISCKYEEGVERKWTVQSVCLDRGDIYNKHRLVGLNLDQYSNQLSNFKTSITEIKFSDNDSKDTDKKINVLKQQIRAQQDSIVRLKESLLRAKNANKYTQHNTLHFNTTHTQSDQKQSNISQHIRDFIDEPEDTYTTTNTHTNNTTNDWLDQIVDDVIKRYDVLHFKTSPIGAKRNIYIDKQFTKLWMQHVTPRFHDEAMMYYWLDYTTAMQMCQGYSKQYIHKENRKFMVAIVNYELRDQHNHCILYGIIICDDEKLEKKNDKYPYKLKTLMTAAQIRMEYGIIGQDLPAKSRKNAEFVDKLLLKRRILRQDLNKINWSNLKLFKSQSTNNDPINKSVTITQKVMKEYCNIALERLNRSYDGGNGNNNGRDLIPIVVIEKHHNYYGIEWVLIVGIIHRNCDVGISFRYDGKMNVFVATAIYLDKGEIESKHKLVGLKFDYCKHLRPFSLRKFKFKSDRHSIINDDDDIAIHNGGVFANGNGGMQQMQNQMLSYKRALEIEQCKVQQLQGQIQQSQNMYANIKYQNDQYLLQQQMVVQQVQQVQQQTMTAYNPYAIDPSYQMNQFQNGYNGYTG